MDDNECSNLGTTHPYIKKHNGKCFKEKSKCYYAIFYEKLRALFDKIFL